MGAYGRDQRSMPFPDNDPRQRERLEQRAAALERELARERAARQAGADEYMRALAAEKKACEEVYKLRGVLLAAVCRECLARPAADDCWTRAVPNGTAWAMCNAARQALPAELLAVAAADEARRAEARRAAELRAVERSKRLKGYDPSST